MYIEYSRSMIHRNEDAIQHERQRRRDAHSVLMGLQVQLGQQYALVIVRATYRENRARRERRWKATSRRGSKP